MHKQLEGDGTDSGEGIQQFLDEGRDGGADSRSNTLNRSSHNKQTLSYHRRGDTSDRAGDQGIQRENGDKGENERREGVGGDARDSLQRSLHLPVEDFGTNYPEYYHDGKGAIEKLLQEKQGQVQGAFYKEGLGDIDLVWGDSKMGLAHILEKHPEVIEKIPEIINDGKILNKGETRKFIKDDKYNIVISENFRGKDKRWLLTAYEDYPSQPMSISDGFHSQLQHESSRSNPLNPNPNTEKLKNQLQRFNHIIEKELEGKDKLSKTQAQKLYKKIYGDWYAANRAYEPILVEVNSLFSDLAILKVFEKIDKKDAEVLERMQWAKKYFDMHKSMIEAKEISDQLSNSFKEAYNKYEGTKSTEYQQTKEIEKSEGVTGITANVYIKVADEIMDRSSLELAHHNNWVKETIKDPFGINFKKSTFNSIRGKEALETLLTYKLGQVKGAFYKEGLGDIDLVWGNKKMGLAHILEKHPEVIEKIPEIIEKGKVENANGVDTIILKSNGGNYHIGISKGWDHKGDNNWIITAYENVKSSHPDVRPSSEVASRDGNNLPSNDFETNPTTEKLKNQELVEEIQQEALDLADKANPTQDTQPYLPLVESVEKRVLQNKAEAKKEIVFNNLEDIKKDLPYLLKEQAEDVKFAEQRFSTGGRGVLFTNGTGTGKTFTGLGIAKRKLKMGAKNILILTQSTQKNLDWKKEGKILNIDIVEVSNTKDNPNGTIIATYANFRENKGLNSRTYDLIIYDESQSILGSKEGSITEIFEQHQNIAIWNYLTIKIINHLCDNAHFYPRSSLVA